MLSISKQVKILLFVSAQRRVGSLGLSMGEFQHQEVKGDLIRKGCKNNYQQTTEGSTESGHTKRSQ